MLVKEVFCNHLFTACNRFGAVRHLGALRLATALARHRQLPITVIVTVTVPMMHPVSESVCQHPVL